MISTVTKISTACCILLAVNKSLTGKILWKFLMHGYNRKCQYSLFNMRHCSKDELNKHKLKKKQ